MTSIIDKKRFTKILILGAGAIGSFYGSQLSKNNNVELIGNKEHIEIINVKGLKLKGAIEEIYNIPSSQFITEIPSNSMLIVTTKAYDLENSLNAIKSLINKDTVIFLLQNGLGNEELSKQILGEDTVILRGICTAGVEFILPGIIDVKHIGETTLPDNNVGRRIAALFSESDLKIILSKNIIYEIWKKLTMNCVINPLTAIFRVPNYLIADKSLKKVISSIVSECQTVAEKEGVTLESGLEDMLLTALSNYSNLSSMCQDIIKQRKTEIEFLNGKISELGDKYNVPTPVNDTLTSLIRFMEGKKWS
ncbi:ketopantoate reductase family protein [Candidatus Bathyarchaeota archaeon]|nr:ketopantoate reductase family protein [Candidatus Bathyarchaeota archaeon]